MIEQIHKRIRSVNTLSSLRTEKDNSFNETAKSLVNLNSKRAAILTPRKIRAVKSELYLLDRIVDKKIMVFQKKMKAIRFRISNKFDLQTSHIGGINDYEAHHSLR